MIRCTLMTGPLNSLFQSLQQLFMVRIYETDGWLFTKTCFLFFLGASLDTISPAFLQFCVMLGPSSVWWKESGGDMRGLPKPGPLKAPSGAVLCSPHHPDSGPNLEVTQHLQMTARSRAFHSLQHAAPLWAMDVNSADRWATRLGPCSEIANIS